MFASYFSEGDSTTAKLASLVSQRADATVCQYERPVPRRRISMPENFHVVHNILYYIYTNRIRFSTVIPEESQTECDDPQLCDAEDIYSLAHRLDIESLKSKALGFLNRSCNTKNITSRVFSEFASVYEEVGGLYENYFRKHWEEVRESAEFKHYFLTMDQEDDPKEINRTFRRFRELVHGAIFVDINGK